MTLDIRKELIKLITIIICLVFSLQALAQRWGTAFPTDTEIAEMDRKYSDQAIMVENHYFPKPGKFNEVLALRTAASKLLKEFGLSAGRVTVTRQTLDSTNGKEEDIAAIVWHCEYQNLAALKKELNSFTPEQEKKFQKEILQKMKLLTVKHKRTSSYVVFE